MHVRFGAILISILAMPVAAQGADVPGRLAAQDAGGGGHQPATA